MNEDMSKTVEDFNHEEKQLLVFKFLENLEGDAKINRNKVKPQHSKMSNFMTPHNLKLDHKVLRVTKVSPSLNVNRREQIINT